MILVSCGVNSGRWVVNSNCAALEGLVGFNLIFLLQLLMLSDYGVLIHLLIDIINRVWFKLMNSVFLRLKKPILDNLVLRFYKGLGHAI